MIRYVDQFVTVGVVLCVLALAAVIAYFAGGRTPDDDDELVRHWARGLAVDPTGEATLVDVEWARADDLAPTDAYATLGDLAPPERDFAVEQQALDAELFFAADPLGSLSLPTQLELADLATDVFVDLMNAGALTPGPFTPVATTWVPWGFELPSTDAVDVPDDASELDGDRELELVGV